MEGNKSKGKNSPLQKEVKNDHSCGKYDGEIFCFHSQDGL